MENSTPFEIMTAPFEVWTAAVGTAFPDVDTAPDTGDWTLVGTSGNKNINEDGVKLTLSQSLKEWKGLGALGITKVFRDGEGVEIAFKLADLSAEQFAEAMEFQTMTTVAAGVGTPGTKALSLSRGRTVNTRALLVRGPSPYMAAGAAQYQVYAAVQAAPAQEIEGKKDVPAMLSLLFKAIENPSMTGDGDRFGKFIAQTADATT